eukprot:GHVU01012584.1.p2 GENE.GHVU01012584.1~~GHVU01012584.1.p2  ORF type:complete len:104 (-),score=9.34 GHVU01012584.1:383-694(-)
MPLRDLSLGTGRSERERERKGGRGGRRLTGHSRGLYPRAHTHTGLITGVPVNTSRRGCNYEGVNNKTHIHNNKHEYTMKQGRKEGSMQARKEGRRSPLVGHID